MPSLTEFRRFLPLFFPLALAAQEPEIEIRRAIVVDELDVIPQFLPPEIDALPRTLPQTVQTTYTRCAVPGPVIAITFDDGPHPEYTPRLLDTLKEREIKATFFMVGRNAAAYPAIVKRMADEGHEVANHTWAHPLLTSYGSEGVESQLRRTHDAILNASGVAPLLYRPPYGAARLTQRRSIQETFGYPTILWDVDPLDWQPPRSVKKVYDRVLAATKPGSIVLLHDIHETTVNAMPATLDVFIARGYQMVTVTQLIQLESQQPAPAPVVAEPALLPVPEAAAAALPNIALEPATTPGGCPVEEPTAPE